METAIRINATICQVNHKDPDQARLDAWRYTMEIYTQFLRLPPMMQAVFQAWLRSQSHGQIESINIKEIFHWLNSLNPGQAEAEYRLTLLEVSWLEILTQDFFNFLSKDAT